LRQDWQADEAAESLALIVCSYEFFCASAVGFELRTPMQKISEFRRLISFLTIIAVLLPAAYAQAPARAAAPKDSGKTVITAESVQAQTSEIIREVGPLRLLKVLRPVKSGVQSRAQIEKMAMRNFEEETKPGELEVQSKTLKIFGLIPEGFQLREFMVKLLTEQVAGFYDPKTKEFFLADWIDLDSQKPVMAHELTHALQDQHFNLRRFEKWPDGDSDRELAIHALIEGDATAVMYDYMLKPNGLSLAKLPVSIGKMGEALMAMTSSEQTQVLKAAPAIIRESLIFPYMSGAGFAQEMLKREGYAGLTKAYRDLPQSTEQILHFDKYLAREMPVKISLPHISHVAGEDWNKLDTDINGEFGYSIILSEYIPREEARKAAAGWGGDQYALYERTGDGHLLLVHRSAWDSAEDAQEFFNSYAARTWKLYPEAEGILAETQRQIFQTRSGQIYLQLDGKSVLIIEGLPQDLANRVDALSEVLWKDAPAIAAQGAALSKPASARNGTGRKTSRARRLRK
jgi:hypothetical protein